MMRRTVVLAASLLCAGLAVQIVNAADPVSAVRELLAQERVDEAVAEAERLTRLHPESVELSSILAETLFRSGRLDEAEEQATELVAGVEPPGRALLLLARLRAAQGRYGEARDLARRAVEAVPEDPISLYWASGLVGDRARGIALLSRYLELSEGDDPDRIAAATGTRGMLLALGDRRVWSTKSRPARVSLPLRRLVTQRKETQGYVVDIRIGDRRKPVPVLLDTGSSGLFIRERVARKGKFRPLATETVFGGGGDQRHLSSRGSFDEVSVGELSFTDATATVTSKALDPKGRYVGILGVGFFGGYRVTIDLDRLRLVLEREGDPPVTGIPYWMIGGHLLVQARTNDDRPRLFLLDTGATTTVLAARYAGSLEGARVGDPADIHGYGGRRLGARHVEGVSVEFQGQETPPGPLSTVDLALRNRLLGVEIAGYLGLDLLDGTRIIIDTRAGRVQVERSAD